MDLYIVLHILIKEQNLLAMYNYYLLDVVFGINSEICAS